MIQRIPHFGTVVRVAAVFATFVAVAAPRKW
jgi:hypothetical protein